MGRDAIARRISAPAVCNNKHPYEDEKRAALDQWASELQRIVAGESNIVALGERHAAKQTAA